MTTLRDLSRELGLSVTQVSRALNNHADVSGATRERVREAARRLAYHPNLAARRLASGRSDLVALVLPGLPRGNDEVLFAPMVAGLSQHLARLGRQFVLHIASPGDDLIAVYRRLIDGGNIDGFVLLEPEVGDRRVEFLRRMAVPFVVHGRLPGAPGHAWFDIDNEGVARALTGHLLGRGHRRIAFLNGIEGRTYVEARAEGYRAALAEAGAEADPGLHRFGEMTEAEGLVAGLALLSGADRPPTAVACGNMRLARGVTQAVAALGLSVPRDVSVVAHDDGLAGFRPAAFDPPLTVTRAPLSDAWEPLAEMIAAATEGAPPASLARLGAFALVEGASVRDLGA